MILTVTPNPALDLTYSLDSVHLGETHRVRPAIARAGGKGVNVARVLHQQGVHALAIATAGGESGQKFASDLERSKVPHLLVPVGASTRTTVAFVESDANRTSIFNESGTNHTPGEWVALTDAIIAHLPQARCLVASGSIPDAADDEFYARLVARATALNVPSVIDTSGPGLLAAAASGATVLKPNRQELLEATRAEYVTDGARRLLALGAGFVLVSLGEEGMLAFTRDDNAPWRARVPSVLAGNPTGAGDAAVAAVAAMLASGNNAPEGLLRTATAWSAAAVLMPLAGEISPAHAAIADSVTIDRPHDTFGRVDEFIRSTAEKL